LSRINKREATRANCPSYCSRSDCSATFPINGFNWSGFEVAAASR
ncbi:hypothetical protein A2U01_0040163, partial [Trifolium medium]|nr:hypothetical protein [Trifolium medium]